MNAPVPHREFLEMELAKSMDTLNRALGKDNEFKTFFMGMFMPTESRPPEFEEIRKKLDAAISPTNAIAKAFRKNTRAKEFPSTNELIKSGAISKAQLDVGTLTNFANITGGQSLGYVSLDTQLARGTVRPNSFTLYQCLHKTGAYQVVDYWPSVTETGGNLPGTAFSSFGNVASGTLATSAGVYNLNNITLKLAVNGRSITTALAAQNSFVDIAAQENINAALTVLASINWANYWGDVSLYPSQFVGIASGIPALNVFDFTAWYADVGVANSWSKAQGLFNLIYEASAQITSYRQYGRITHAFMTPTTAGSLQSLVTTLLNNIVTQITPSQERLSGIVVDGDLQGMRTRFGDIQFPIDLFIDARDKPAAAIDKEAVPPTNYATLTAPTRPVSVVAAVSGATTGSAWSGAYVAAAGSGIYSYAVASTDAGMNESTLTYLSSGAGVGSGLAISGIAAGGSVALTITPPGAADAAVFRVYRSGLGYAPATSGVANPSAYRYIGSVAANGSTPVVFNDLNTHIPGSQSVFLLDLDENDYALDFRYMLPLTKVELFAQNLYMPWAVCMIGAVRLRIPKFHGLINNYVADQPAWDPLQSNANVA